jgi:hypothetical protein
MRVVPYTHWAYFDDRDAATGCGEELATQDFLCGVDPVEPVDPAAFAADVAAGRITGPPEVLADLVRQAAANPQRQRQWLLRAAREVAVEGLIAQHELVEEIVERHGGDYDGGETGLLDPRTGEPVRQADS